MNFEELSVYFEKLEKTPSRLTMTEILAELLAEVSVEEAPIVVNLSLGQLKPKFDHLEFALAEKMVMRAMALAFGEDTNAVVAEFKKIGDLGTLAEELKKKNEKLKTTTENSKRNIKEVYEELVRIAEDSGQGSQERKVTSLSNLFKDLDTLSCKFLARMVVGKLRLGFSDMTILDSLSWMETGGKGKRKALENTYQLYPDIGELAKMVKEVGIDRVEDKAEVKLGVPVIPALAQRLKTADEMIEKMGKVAVEPKYDGTRVQIHYRKTKNEELRTKNFGASGGFGDGGLFDGGEKKDWEVRSFTRNLDETTHMFPELVNTSEHVNANELILDCEAIGFNPETGQMRPFQETIQRKRKHGIAEAAESIPLKFFVFDVLYKDGESLVKVPYHVRREILRSVIKDDELFVLDQELVTESPEELRKYHAEQLALGLEGALVKKWDGIYEPGRRGWSWVKFKETEDSKAKLSDTVDAVVMGLYVGKGKRTGFGVGAFLIGIRAGDETKNEELITNNFGASGGFVEGMFYTISKVGTGLTDEQWRELKHKSSRFKVQNCPKEYVVDKNLEPDEWLMPGLVVEIAADEVTKSPIHTAGLALRFPRLVRFRDDKSGEQTTSITEISVMGGFHS